MTKIVLINHSFQINYFSRRWELFAQCHPDIQITLLAPSEYEWYAGSKYTFGNSKLVTAKAEEDNNFSKRLFRMRAHKHKGWDSPDFKDILCEIRPDVIYHIGTHTMESLLQVIKIRNRFLPNAKVIAFSMRGPSLNLKYNFEGKHLLKSLLKAPLYLRGLYNLKFVNRNIDAIFCHYPDAVKCFRDEGYGGPIYMQTQVGVNSEWFHEDKNARIEIRRKYGISDSTFVFGSASRFTTDKGIDVILNALPNKGDWKYLMMGSGSDEDMKRLNNIIQERNLADKVIITGFVDWYDMAKYWNAVDCAIHVPLTTPQWEETFSLAVIQPQITKKPIIGDMSGSVPYQVGFAEMLVPENDVVALRDKMIWAMNNKRELNIIAERMYDRTRCSFEIRHLNDLFYRTIVEDVIPGNFDMSKFDMSSDHLLESK